MKLKVNGKDLEFSFGLGFLGELLEETGKSMDEVLVAIDKNPYKFIPTAMFVSTKFAYERQGKTIDFTKFDFFDWLEADGGLTDKNESAIKFMNAFSQSLFKDVPQEEATEDKAPKKK